MSAELAFPFGDVYLEPPGDRSDLGLLYGLVAAKFQVVVGGEVLSGDERDFPVLELALALDRWARRVTRVRDKLTFCPTGVEGDIVLGLYPDGVQWRVEWDGQAAVQAVSDAEMLRATAAFKQDLVSQARLLDVDVVGALARLGGPSLRDEPTF